MTVNRIPLVNRLRQADLPTVPASFSAWLELDGKEYAIVKLAVRYSRTETKIVVDLASGNASRNTGGRPAVPADFEFIRGTPAKVWLEVDKDVEALWAGQSSGRDLLLKKGTHVLADGVVDDGGPSDLAKGRFNMRCVIVSKLLYMASGATHFSNVSASHLNTTLLTNLVGSGAKAAVNADLAGNDFWNAVRSAIIGILDTRFFGQTKNDDIINNRVGRFVQFAGTEFGDIPEATIRAITSIYGALPSGTFSNGGMVDVVTNYLNRELSRDLGRQSILARVQALADDFFFALIEHGLGSAIVPYTPFVHSSECKDLWPSTVESVQWTTHDTAIVSGMLFVDSPFGSLTRGRSAPQTSEQFIIGGFKRRTSRSAVNDIDLEGNNLGLITTLPAPSWMKATNKDDLPSVNARNVQSDFGNIYARELCLKQSYMGRSVLVRGPLRMDIGPCTPVRVVYPAIAGAGPTEETSMFGAVEAITLVMDASAAKAMSEMEVMYVRSKAQQELDVDERPVSSTGQPGFGGKGSGFVSTQGFHPLWSSPYLGRRLDERPSDTITETESSSFSNKTRALFGED